MERKQRTALIIGAGPAGLTAAYELLKRSDIIPYVIESDKQVGGLAKTIDYKGNKIDIGGHRFFSKSDRVIAWWQSIMPFEDRSYASTGSARATFNNAAHPKLVEPSARATYSIGAHPEVSKGYAPIPAAHPDLVMLRRNRLSRIYYLRRFFDYPVSLSLQTLKNLGITRVITIIISYLRTRISPIKKERSLEDFFINRFGKTLYGMFFRDYTQKVWGIPASSIKPEWGAQRIKGISITKIITHAFKSIFKRKKSESQKEVETSWIHQFWYPKFGPGQLWEEVDRQVQQMGGTVLLEHEVVGLTLENKRITQVRVRNLATNVIIEFHPDHVFSSMPIKDLINCMEGPVPQNVKEVANGLAYRDFITVGILLDKLHLKCDGRIQNMISDSWIYIQEPDVKVGRIQIFNNWSPFLVKDPNMVWIGLEYFAQEGDELWQKSEAEFSAFAVAELVKLDMAQEKDIKDSTVIKIKKAYPVYFGSYDRFDEIKTFINSLENLIVVGRNGMHKYNNQDHSMLTALQAVDALLENRQDMSFLWNVNTEKEYHEAGSS